jgi:exopolysaccharide biosynthesis protein
MKEFIKNNRKILFVFLFFVFLAVAGDLYSKIGPSKDINPSDKDVVKTAEILQKYLLYVEEKNYEISVPENTTVYGLMDSLKQRGDISFNGKSSAEFGFFVEEINGKKNSADTNTYWIYYINDKAAAVGISSYVLKPGDIISWKYETPQF